MDAASIHDASHDASEPPNSAGVRRLLAELTASLDRLADQQQTIADQQALLAEVRRRWQEEWGSALAALAKREAALLQREEALRIAEHAARTADQSLQVQSAQLRRRERTVECREVQAARREAGVATERSRHIARLRMRGVALQAQIGRLARLQGDWEKRREAEQSRLWALQADCKQERDELREERELLRLKLSAVAQRERGLLEREFVVAQAEQQLLATDPEPSAAQAELERRLEKLHEVVGRPLRGLERQQRELEREHRALDTARLAATEVQERVECEHLRLQALQREVDARQLKLTTRKSLWQARLRGHRLEQERLRKHVRELEVQLERLAMLLLDAPPEESAIRIAA